MTTQAFRAGPMTKVINPTRSLDAPRGASAPLLEIPFAFAMQSILDVTVSQYAILPQPVSQQIVQTTLDNSQQAGYALALSPDSECPVRVQFKGGENGQKTNSSYVTLTPGEIVRPVGIGGCFNGFDYGLPQGWLGGGNGRLIVFKSHDSYLRYIAQISGSESLFHQMAYAVVAADNTTQKPNWPKRFPWKNAKSELNADGTVASQFTSQGGPGYLVVRPSRVIFELVCNAAGLAAPESVTPYIHKDGAAIPMAAPPINFPPVAAGNNSVVVVSGDAINMLAGDDTYVNFVGATAASQGKTLNIYRYGSL